VGGGAPVVVQSMTMTDTADAVATARQCIELAEAGSEMVRVTVNLPEAAATVPEIKQRMLDAGCTAPLIGDFHYNGHLLLTRYPAMAAALDKYRINPGNVGTGKRRDEQFATICKVAVDQGKPVRIGVNGGSLNQELVLAKMQENTDRNLGRDSEEILNECMVISGVESTALAIESGCARIRSSSRARCRGRAISSRSTASSPARPTSRCTSVSPRPAWAERAGVVGVGDGHPAQRRDRRHHPRVAHAAPGGDRRDEVYAACELLQALGCARSRRASPPAPAAAAPPAARSRSWPNARRSTSASSCRSGRRATRAWRR
jgi:(E)-4-hydroxy-3-methylbut-2-enyl-diphosphate synthase